MEDDETSLILNDEKQNQNVISAEDFAWADSCLIEDPEIAETDMNSLLVDILDQHSEMFGKYFDNSYGATEEGTSCCAETSIDGEVESHDVVSIIKQQPFHGNYNDEMMKIQYCDDEDAGFVLSELVTEAVFDDIFKVWDLEIRVEEEEEEEFCWNAGCGVPKKKLESVDSLVESIAQLCLE